MIKFKFILFICIIPFVSFNCKKVAKFSEKNYPVIITGEVSEFTEAGFKISAEFFGSVNDINSWGFILNDDKNFLESGEGEKFEFNSFENNSIHTELIVGIIPEKYYYIRAFAETDKYYVLGNIRSFLKPRTSQPVIDSISAEFCSPGEKIIVYGNHFTDNLDESSVTLNGKAIDIDKIEVVKETETTAVLDGFNGMGHVISKKAMNMAIRQ